TKPPTCVIGPGAPVTYHTVTQALDYEVELAVVFGRRGRDIPAAKALDYVFGYTIMNDVTARDLQRRHQQWFKGKSLDTFAPLGPWIVHRSAIPDPQRLRLTMRVNGELRQNATSASMIFGVAQLIESLSAGMTIEPGDIMATGTPEGVQAGLSWDTILRKRSNFRRAFSRFDPRRVARYASGDIRRLMTDAGIIRNRAKILAAIANARAFLEVVGEFGSFNRYIWGF